MTTESAVTFDGDRMIVGFDRFDVEAYGLFLRTKTLPEKRVSWDWRTDRYTLTAPARFAEMLGVARPSPAGADVGFAAHLWDYQSTIVRTALDARRYALWADTGLGKTAMFLEWARHVAARTGGRVLVFSPLNIIPQTCAEAERFHGDELRILPIGSRAALRKWAESGEPGVAITNYEKMIPKHDDEVVDELRLLSGVVLDESSILKTGGGRIKWALIKSCRGVEYKLSCTATPAPNEVMEYASQAAFLEKLRSEGEILWTWFVRNPKTNEWRLRAHAEADFYRFMAGWSVYLRDPARYGFADNLRDLPAPEIHLHELEATPEQRAAMAGLPNRDGQLSLLAPESPGVTERSKMMQLARGFIYEKGKRIRRVPSAKPGFVADLARRELDAGHQVLVWTVFDEEGTLLAELLEDREPALLTGKTGAKRRVGMIEAFRSGDSRLLISKPSLLGLGLNLQCCTSMIFSGFDDSFERFYQAVRRAYRYGQTRPVRVHVPYVPELEGAVWENVQAKQAAFERDCAIMERCYIEAMREVMPERVRGGWRAEEVN